MLCKQYENVRFPLGAGAFLLLKLNKTSVASWFSEVLRHREKNDLCYVEKSRRRVSKWTNGGETQSRFDNDCPNCDSQHWAMMITLNSDYCDRAPVRGFGPGWF